MSKTDEPGARSSSEVMSDGDIWIYDRNSPDFINLGNPVKLAPQSVSNDTDFTTRLGGWLFRHRTSLPLPFAAAIVAFPAGQTSRSAGLVAAGVAVTVLGELLRLWGVHQIGAISRTRTDRLGPLVESGPFAMLRNPLYVGNIALWVGFALAARLVWLAPVIAVLLGLEYHAIVRWEEHLLESRLGDAYRSYAARVPRWVPTFNREERGTRREKDLSAFSAGSAGSAVRPYSWRETLFSERGTLIAMAAGYLLLWIKSQV
jgi:protein-S-isoprenylcysteine O-methyltransferase Ste14